MIGHKEYQIILLRKFINGEITNRELIKLWEEILIYEQAYMYSEETDKNKRLLEEGEVFVSDFYTVCVGKLSIISCLFDIDERSSAGFEHFLNNIKELSTRVIFQFFNTNPDWPGTMIDVVLIRILNNKIDLSKFSTEIEPVILEFANGDQKEIYLKLKEGESIDSGRIKLLSENYYKALFKINTVKFLNFLNKPMNIKKSFPHLWKPITEEFSFTLKKKLTNKILDCQLRLCDKEILESIDKIISSCWESIIEDVKLEPKSIQNALKNFIYDNFLKVSTQSNVAANYENLALVANGDRI